eukprot:1157956-Pelagomonas_calceolata.AAC.2
MTVRGQQVVVQGVEQLSGLRELRDSGCKGLNSSLGCVRFEAAAAPLQALACPPHRTDPPRMSAALGQTPQTLSINHPLRGIIQFLLNPNIHDRYAHLRIRGSTKLTEGENSRGHRKRKHCEKLDGMRTGGVKGYTAISSVRQVEVSHEICAFRQWLPGSSIICITRGQGLGFREQARSRNRRCWHMNGILGRTG